jgi:hypothetical protein
MRWANRPALIRRQQLVGQGQLLCQQTVEPILELNDV